MSLKGTKRLIFHTLLSHFVRVLTHYGSNESNDSLGFFCEHLLDQPIKLVKNNLSVVLDGLFHGE